MLVRRNRLMEDATIPKFKLCDNDLSEVDEAKYLGHLIKNDGKDDIDIQKACGKLYAQGNSLIRKFTCSLRK